MDHIIDGIEIAQKTNILTRAKVEKLVQQGVRPSLHVVLVGRDRPSRTYIRRKREAAESAGIIFVLHELEETISKAELINYILNLQQNDKPDGLIVQLPLPDHLYAPEVLNAIDPEHDVDCLTDTQLGRLVMKTNYIAPPTPAAVLTILDSIDADLRGKHVTIVGAGALVGKPLSIMLLNREATVTTCNIHTTHLKRYCREADIIVTAVGKKDLLTGPMVKRGTIVIDTGINFVHKKMYGDVDFAKVAKKASYITPTPGGVGPITVSILLKNTVTCAARTHDIDV